MSRFICYLLLIPLYLFSLQSEPSLPAPYTFEFKNSYAYQYIPSIDQAINPIDFHSHNNFYLTSISGSLQEGQAMFLELGFNATSISSFNFLQATFEYRLALLNELIGDALSVQIAPVITFVPAYRIKDVNTAYQNIFNFSTIVSFGKEFDQNEDWVAKIFAAIEGGISSGAGPFVGFEVDGRVKIANTYIFKLALNELIGFGDTGIVNVSNFDGWSRIDHQSIKVNGALSYIVGVYGNLELSYFYQLYAKSYYQNDSTFQITYSYPFSP